MVTDTVARQTDAAEAAAPATSAAALRFAAAVAATAADAETSTFFDVLASKLKPSS
jgi:hypothetical protein